jgi:hypothetical protein
MTVSPKSRLFPQPARDPRHHTVLDLLTAAPASGRLELALCFALPSRHSATGRPCAGRLLRTASCNPSITQGSTFSFETAECIKTFDARLTQPRRPFAAAKVSGEVAPEHGRDRHPGAMLRLSGAFDAHLNLKIILGTQERGCRSCCGASVMGCARTVATRFVRNRSMTQRHWGDQRYSRSLQRNWSAFALW